MFLGEGFVLHVHGLPKATRTTNEKKMDPWQCTREIVTCLQGLGKFNDLRTIFFKHTATFIRQDNTLKDSSCNCPVHMIAHTHMHTHTCKHTYKLHTHMQAYTHMHTHTHMQAHTHTHTS